MGQLSIGAVFLILSYLTPLIHGQCSGLNTCNDTYCLFNSTDIFLEQNQTICQVSNFTLHNSTISCAVSNCSVVIIAQYVNLNHYSMMNASWIQIETEIL